MNQEKKGCCCGCGLWAVVTIIALIAVFNLWPGILDKPPSVIDNGIGNIQASIDMIKGVVAELTTKTHQVRLVYRSDEGDVGYPVEIAVVEGETITPEVMGLSLPAGYGLVNDEKVLGPIREDATYLILVAGQSLVPYVEKALENRDSFVEIARWTTPVTFEGRALSDADEAFLKSEAIDFTEKISAAIAEQVEVDYRLTTVGSHQLQYQIGYERKNRKEIATTTISLRLVPAMSSEEEAIVQSYVDDLIREANKREEGLERLLFVHDAIVDRAMYATDELAGDRVTESGHSIFNPVAIVVDRRGVCDAYTKLFMKVLTDMDIPVRYVTGQLDDDQLGVDLDETGNPYGHSWNMVELDGQWYHIDLTWDDPVYTDDLDYQVISHDFFLKSTETITTDGMRTLDSANYPPAQQDYPIAID